MYVNVFSQSLALRYGCDIFSVTFWVNSFLVLVNLILPYMIVYQTGELWKRVEFSQQRPFVQFADQLVLRAQIRTDSSSLVRTQLWSTVSQFNQRIKQTNMRIPSYYVINYRF